MSNEINDLAIILTRAIESEIVMLCSRITSADEALIRAAPNFFMIREAILRKLDEYMDVLRVEIKDSPEELRQMPKKMAEDYINHKAEQAVACVVREILNSPDHFNKFEFRGEWDYYRSLTRTIIVMKTAKIYNDEAEVSKEMVEEIKKRNEDR